MARNMNDCLEKLYDHLKCSICSETARYRKKGGDLWKYKWVFCEKHKRLAASSDDYLKENFSRR